MNKALKMDREKIKKLALHCGFSFCGMAKAEKLVKEKDMMERWLGLHLHADLAYMERNTALRADPSSLVENARSVIVMAMRYYSGNECQQNTKYKVARYALGDDYHDILKDKAKWIVREIVKEEPGFSFKICVDSSPVMEKAWAVKAGLGGIGKNGLVVIPAEGSFFLLCLIITDMPLEYDDPFSGDVCGECRLCMNACPAAAIAEPGLIDAGKCIASVTIEKSRMENNPRKQHNHGRIFGCDICQEACPHNKFSETAHDECFAPYPFFSEVTDDQWERLSEEKYFEIFSKSPLRRASFSGLKANILEKNGGNE